MTTALEARKVLTLEEVARLLEATVFCGSNLSIKVSEVGAADMMSDVLALSKPGMLLLTGLISLQVVRTAVVSDLSGIVLVRGKKPSKEILDLAVESGIPMLGTSMTMFKAAGVLYGAIFAG